MTDPTFGDLVHDGEIYDQFNCLTVDLPFYRRQCRAGGEPILELCCGTGRLTVPLADEGFAIQGLDRSESMLAQARKKVDERELDLQLHRGDMRDFSLGETFGTIFLPYNSLQAIHAVDQLESVFERVRAHLRPEGRFVFDIFNPDIELMVERAEGWREMASFETDEGRQVTIREQTHYDAARQVNSVEMRFDIGDETLEDRLEMRCFYPREMDALLGYNGFEILDKFGTFEEEPFESTSRKQIYVCKLAD